MTPPDTTDEPRPSRILVVDDEKGVNDLIIEILESMGGHRCNTACSLDEALDELASGTFDAVVVDACLDGKRGSQLYQVLSSRKDPLAKRLVFISGKLDDPEIEEIARNTGNAFVHKPFRIDELLATVRCALSAESTASLSNPPDG